MLKIMLWIDSIYSKLQIYASFIYEIFIIDKKYDEFINVKCIFDSKNIFNTALLVVVKFIKISNVYFDLSQSSDQIL